MLMVWLISPLISMTMFYLLVKLFIESDLYTIFILGSPLIAIIIPIKNSVFIRIGGNIK
jgi:sulfate permease